MSGGANHERVPGSDAEPLIGVETSDALFGWSLVVRLFRPGGGTQEVFRRTYSQESEATTAEVRLRLELRHAPHGDVRQVLRRWNADIEDWPDWWT